MTGTTLEAHKTFKRILHKEIVSLKEVSSEADSDVILVFCPIVSSIEHNIKAALQKLDEIPGNRTLWVNRNPLFNTE